MQVYRLHESTLDFAITVELHDTLLAADATAAAGKVMLTPMRTAAATDSGRIAARLVGGIAPKQSYPELTSQFLLMPTNADLSAIEFEEWLLVDNTYVTLDDSECNKIGTSFSAFVCAIMFVQLIMNVQELVSCCTIFALQHLCLACDV